MNKPYIAAILAITRLAFSSALANTMPSGTHKILRRNCQTDFIAKTKKSALFSGNENGMCLAMAKNTEKFEVSETHTQCRSPRASVCNISIDSSREVLRPESEMHRNLRKNCFACTKPDSAMRLNCYAAFF